MVKNEFIEKVQVAVEGKEKLLNQHFPLYALRAIYAGMFLTIATVCAAMAANVFQDPLPYLAKFVYAIIFPFGLMMILVLKTELATSNMMYTMVGQHQGLLKISSGIKIVLICTFFNWCGAILMALLMSWATNAQQITETSFLVNVAQAKLAKSLLSIFIEAILANIFVNIAIIGQMNIKNEFAKLFFVEVVIFMFAYFGYEHVIANFSVFSMVGFTGHSLPWGQVLMQWLVAFLGNVVGGGVIMGLGYSLLNRNTL
ncbi:formate/nitrite transporter family protein [Ignavigranum ruoffiae]|uniref:formate/nitrite transporter family protein n=1 Tax=Ignavigranum ruoffiae TaxID=89093 RepID=UPI002067D53D|nr:formate/nitrite transporter family protein [Ignavigranum ruoffiae]UPQ86359.1 formate/nitrite transporter family protein [Ignavigranum ruoffiae]